MQDGSLTTSKPELLSEGHDGEFRAMLYGFFAFSHSLETARAKFARHIGLSSTQYLVLIEASRAPQAKKLGISQIAKRLRLSGAFVTIEVNKLVAEGLVEKLVPPTDGRRVLITVTKAGHDRLAGLAALQRPVNDALFEGVSREEFQLLSGLLSRLAANGDYALKLAEQIEAALRRGAGTGRRVPRGNPPANA